MSIGDELREVREARGFSLGEVERRSGGKLTDGGLSRIEKGQREPLLGTLVTLSEVLGAKILIQRGVVKISWTKNAPRKKVS